MGTDTGWISPDPGYGYQIQGTDTQIMVPRV